MNWFLSAFNELYAVQTAEVGTAIVASVALGATTYCTNAPALLSGNDQNAQFMEGTTAEGGGYDIKIRLSDMAVEPPKGTPVTTNGSAAGTQLQVISCALVNGIWQIQVGDIQA